jgi:hypothetical protein
MSYLQFPQKKHIFNGGEYSTQLPVHSCQTTKTGGK